MAVGGKEERKSMNPSPDNSASTDRGTALAEERTDVALDRTLMAWVRTTLSVISFGFTIFKFFQYFQQTGEAAKWRPEMPKNLGSSWCPWGRGC
jgi:putative membrane protein